MFDRKISAETRTEALAALYMRTPDIKDEISNTLTDEATRNYWRCSLARVEAAIKELETP